MSLLNIALSPGGQRAYLAVDTAAADAGGGKLHHVTKLFALPHLHAVMGGRGLFLTLLWVFGEATVAPTLEDLCESIPLGIDAARAAREKLLLDAPSSVTDEEAATTIAVVAWSEGRIVARVWNGFEDSAHALYDVQSAYLAPNDGSLTGVPLTPAEMEAVARKQVAMVRKDRPDYSIGGELILANIDERGISIRTLCNLDDQSPATAAADSLGQLARGVIPISILFGGAREGTISIRPQCDLDREPRDRPPPMQGQLARAAVVVA